MEGKMALLPESAIWKEIDVSESYLVCGMFEEAASLASSIVRRLSTDTSTKVIDDSKVADMLESAGMVFVQSLKELGRTPELLIELEMLFSSVAAIPVQVFLSGACIQISEGFSSNLKIKFEEFLGKWKYLEKQFYVLSDVEPQSSSAGGCTRQPLMDIENYLEVAEVYAITLLGMDLRDTDLAISWTERAELPEENRQDFLRRLHSLHFARGSSSSLGPETSHVTERNSELSVSGAGCTISGGEDFPKAIKAQCKPNGSKSKPANLKSMHPSTDHFSDRVWPCFWWFRTVLVKCGSAQLLIPSGKAMFWGSLMIFTYYILRRKGTVIKRIAARRALSIRRALIDAWQLAFSVQVNPLAAVQPLPPAPRGSR